MTDEELAALTIALELLEPPQVSAPAQEPRSRWKLADRMPALEMEELRALH